MMEWEGAFIPGKWLVPPDDGAVRAGGDGAVATSLSQRMSVAAPSAPLRSLIEPAVEAKEPCPPAT